jgi:hypothetical protein
VSRNEGELQQSLTMPFSSVKDVVWNSMLAPATCNLLNIDKTATVDNAFMLLKELSIYLKERYL